MHPYEPHKYTLTMTTNNDCVPSKTMYEISEPHRFENKNLKTITKTTVMVTELHSVKYTVLWLQN